MAKTVRVTLLVENTMHGPDLLAEHGLAYWIEQPDGRAILFDTGQGRVLIHNAFQLGVAWDRLEAVALSHGHYDHTGGLAQVWSRVGEVKVYAHPAFSARKFARPKDGRVREIGLPAAAQEALHRHPAALQPAETPTEILPGLMLTGQVPRKNPWEDTGGPFFLDPAGQTPDPLLDDQALYFPCAEGTVVLLGCAHAGLVNTLRYIQELTHDAPIHAVIGGMHLGSASPERMEFTLQSLRQMGIGQVAPAHCTGWSAVVALADLFGVRCTPCCVGARFEFAIA